MGPLNGRGASAAVVLLIVLMLAERVSSYIMAWREPFQFSSAFAEPAVLRRGDTLQAHYIFERFFYCNTDLNRFIIAMSNNEVLWRERVIGGATAVGKARVINPVRLDKAIGPGEYILRTITYSACQNGAHTMISPDIVFTVTE